MDVGLYRLLGLQCPSRLSAAYRILWERYLVPLAVVPAFGLVLSSAAGDFRILRPVVAIFLFLLCALVLGAVGIFGERWYELATRPRLQVFEIHPFSAGVHEKQLDVLNRQEI